MQVNQQINQSIKIVTKKEITVRKVLNIYGCFLFIGMIVAIYTHPISMNENGEFYLDEKIVMSQAKQVEFILFLLGCAVLYFFIVNLWHRKK
ncbi:hypothetical protein [Robertmurraya massiliosenegalensis]|uniref:hypothetical protein n=1 Tax=Robertmurraya massiliosenegalensis TaxID=1287657 RepID=UPI0002F2E2BF|nr:hypothetical protein [Robertmurraya massiliosenegalensis]